MAKDFCKNCDLYKTSCAGTEGQYKLNCIESIGPKDAKIMVIGMCPGVDECKSKEPFTGDSGKKLNDCLGAAGLSRKEVYITNLVRCRPPRTKKSSSGMDDRDPLMKEIKACKEYLDNEIAEVEPRVLILLGNVVTKAITGQTGITQIHGHPYWNEDYGVTCIPVYHPNYLINKEYDVKVEMDFVNDLKFAKEASKTKEFTEKSKMMTNYFIADTLPKVEKLLDRLKGLKEFVNDIETTGLDPRDSDMLCTAFSWKEGTGAVIPLKRWFRYFSETITGLGEIIYEESKVSKRKGKEILGYIQVAEEEQLKKKKTSTYTPVGEIVYKLEDIWTPNELKIIKDKLIPILENENIKKIGHNLAFDVCYTSLYWDIDYNGAYYCTMYGDYLPDPERVGGRALEDLAWMHTDMGGYDAGLKKQREVGFRDTDEKDLYKYNAADCDCTYRIRNAQSEKMKPFMDILTNIQVPLSIAIREMEYNGVKVDLKHIEKLSKKYEKEIKMHENNLYNLSDVKEFIDKFEKEQAGELEKKWSNSTLLKKRITQTDYVNTNTKKFNFGSTVHLRQLLFDHLQLPIEAKTPSGLPSTNEKTLEGLKGQHDVIDSMLELRHLNKIYSTYLRPIPQQVDKDYRLHTHYRLDRTATGRAASNKPNLQNIPKKKDGKDIRDYFIASEENVLLEFDLRQIEFRILAHFVNDKKMIKDIENGLDIHRLIASEIYNIPQDQVIGEQRDKSKAVTFGVPYGRSSVSLAAEYGMSIDEAEAFRQALLNRYPKVPKWIDRMIQKAGELGYVKTYFGRRRFLPKMNDKNDKIREAEERKVVATAVQGTASDILATYTINIRNKLKEIGSKTKMILTVHDALFFDTPKDEAKKIIPIIKKEMERDIEGIKVPIKTEIKIGTRWGSMVLYEE